MNELLLLFMCSLVFFSRVIYHALANFSGDFPAHILFIREIRANKHRIPNQISAYLPSGRFGYHCGVHWVLSFIPERFEKVMTIAYGPIIEMVHALIIYILMYHGIGSHITSDPFAFAFIIALFTLSCPILNRADGRGYSINGRSAGNLFFNVSLVSIIIYLNYTPNTGWLLLALGSTTLMLITSQFAFQAFLFFSLLFAINGYYHFLLLLVSGMVASEIISFGVYHRFLWINSIKHKLLLFNYRKKYEHVNRFTSFYSVITSLLKCIKNPKSTLEALYRNPIISGFIHLPITFFIIFGSLDATDNLWLIWAVSGILTMLFTFLPVFRFLGEPHRYLEYIALPCSYIFIRHYPDFGLPHILILSWFLIVQLLNYYAIWSSPYSSKNNPQDDKAHKFLRSVKPGNTLVIPTFAGIKIALYCRHKIVEFTGIMGSTPQSNREFSFVYPEEFDYPNRNLSELINKYNIHYIVLDLTRLLKSTRYDDYDLNKYKNIFKNDNMAVYSVT